eukprot:446923-Rhodomonas_salina.1
MKEKVKLGSLSTVMCITSTVLVLVVCFDGCDVFVSVGLKNEGVWLGRWLFYGVRSLGAFPLPEDPGKQIQYPGSTTLRPSSSCYVKLHCN